MLHRLAATYLLTLAAATGSASAQDQLVKQALDVISKHEVLESSLQSGDAATAKRYLNQLGRAQKRLKAAYDKTTTHWKKASTRYNDLVAKIAAKASGKPVVTPESPNPPAPTPTDTPKPADRRALEVLNSKVQKAFHNLKSLNVVDLDNAARVTKAREDIAGFRATLAGMPQGDANVQLVTDNVTAMENLLNAGLTQLEASRAPAGAVERLAAMTAFYQGSDLLGPIEMPIEPARAEAWAREFRLLRDERMPQDLAWLDSIRGKVGVERKPWQRVRGWIASSWPLRIRSLLEQNEERIYAPARGGIMFLDTVFEIDPTNEHHIVNRILAEGQLDRQMTELRNAKAALEVAQAYDRGLARKDTPDYAAQLVRVEKATEHVRNCALTALDKVRMPAAASTDPKLIKIATETLKKKDYGVGNFQSLVINSKLRSLKKKEGSIQGNAATNSATITLYDYDWDEFQVATAEKVGDQFWIFYNRLRFYRSGGPTTPTERWILADRFKTTPILEANLPK